MTKYDAEQNFFRAFDDLSAGRTLDKEPFMKAWEIYRDACEEELTPKLYCQFCGVYKRGNEEVGPICQSTLGPHSYRELGVRG